MHAGAADRTVLGIGLSFLAFAVLSSADALTKLLSARYSVYEIAAVDGIAALLTLGVTNDPVPVGDVSRALNVAEGRMQL